MTRGRGGEKGAQIDGPPLARSRLGEILLIMAVAVVYTKSAAKDVAGLPAIVRARIADKIVELQAYPSVQGVKALKGALKGQFRVRVGNYRILFTVGAGTRTIIAVDDRKEAY